MEFECQVNNVKLVVELEINALCEIENTSVFAHDSKEELWNILSESAKQEINDKADERLRNIKNENYADTEDEEDAL